MGPSNSRASGWLFETLLTCSLIGLHAYAQSATQAQPVAAMEAAAGPYILEPGDTIDLKFFYNPELNDTVQIRPDGRITMPLIGEVTVAGQSVSQVMEALRQKYRGIVRQPEIAVQVRSFANRKVFVGGEVARPGMIALVGKQSVLGAIMESGGLRPTANRSQAYLIRRLQDGQVATYAVSLKDRSGQTASAATTMLQPFDVVVVNRSGVAKADQAVDQYVRQMIPVLLTGGFSYLFNFHGTVLR